MPKQTSTLRPHALEAIQPLARDLAAREAHRPDDIDDLVQVGMMTYHAATQSLARRRRGVEKPWAFARTVLIRAMRAYYFQQGEWQCRGQVDLHLRLDAGAEAGSTTDFSLESSRDHAAGLDGRAGSQMELLEMSEYFTRLQQACGARARVIVENLVLPQGVCAARILGEVRGKQLEQARLRRRGRQYLSHQPRGVKKSVRVTPRMIRDALGLSAAEWACELSAIRTFTRGWLTVQARG